MCDFDGRLVAWLDRELPEDEAADIERHLKVCAECRRRAEAYERTSIAFNAYCDAVSAVAGGRRALPPKMAVLGAGALAAIVVLTLLARHPRTEAIPPQPHVSAQDGNAPTAVVQRIDASTSPSQPAPSNEGSIRKGRQRHFVAAEQKQDANLLPAGPAVEIDIPAEAVLPPGAAVAGENFVVDLSIAPDGSAQGIRLRPQLIGLERRGSQP
jgi:hypothetical protein